METLMDQSTDDSTVKIPPMFQADESKMVTVRDTARYTVKVMTMCRDNTLEAKAVSDDFAELQRLAIFDRFCLYVKLKQENALIPVSFISFADSLDSSDPGLNICDILLMCIARIRAMEKIHKQNFGTAIVLLQDVNKYFATINSTNLQSLPQKLFKDG